MEFRILGPLEVSSVAGDAPLGGVKKRAVLALLVLHANEAVSVDRLVDELWPESPPKTAAKTVRVYVSQLRKALDGDGRLETSGRGYVLRLEDRDLDAARFDALLAEGRSLLAAGQPTRAAEVLREALAHSGEGRRSRTSRTSRSPRRRSPAWRNAGSCVSRNASRPISRWHDTRTSSPSSRRSSGTTR